MQSYKDEYYRKMNHRDLIITFNWHREEHLKHWRNDNSPFNTSVFVCLKEVQRRLKTNPKFNCLAQIHLVDFDSMFTRKDFGKKNWNPE